MHIPALLKRAGGLLTLTLWIVPFFSMASAQEFEVQVNVNMDEISSSEAAEDAEQLGPLIREYLESNRWTGDEFENHERIRVNMQVILHSVDDGRFNATLVLSTLRPIYNTMQATQLLLHNDSRWSFELDRSHSLTHDENRFDEIASMLDYYAYLILGIDYDSFSELGGTPYYRNAQSIVDIAQGQGAEGWSRTGSNRNRFDLITLLLDPGYEELRRAYYHYHRHALDRFTLSTEEAWENGIEALEMMREAQRQTSRNYPFDIIFNTKYREFTAFFQDADPETRVEAYNLLTDMDQSHVSEYNKLQ